ELEIGRIGRDANSGFAKAPQDGEIEVAAGGERVLDITAEATQLDVERKYAKSHEHHIRSRRAHDLRMRLRNVELDLAHPVHVAVVTDAQLDGQASDRIAVRHVFDHARDQVLVGDDYARTVERLDLGRAHADPAHEPLLVLDQHPVADPDRPLRQQDDAADEVGDDRL